MNCWRRILAGLFGMVAVAPIAAVEPASNPTAIDVAVGNHVVRLDRGGQVLHLSVPDDRGFDLTETRKPPETPLEAVAAPRPGGMFVSASLFAQKVKQFDDGLYAATDLAAEQGAGNYAGKAKLLTALAHRLTNDPRTAMEDAPLVLLAACQLGGLKTELPPALAARVQARVDQFLADPLRSKPLGFYTWSNPLAAIFQQDRMLQAELMGPTGIAAIVDALKADAAARSAAEGYLELVAKLTNPLSGNDIRHALAASAAGQPLPITVRFFPPSRAHETDLVMQLFGNKPIPAGFSLVDEMVSRIRAGKMSLQPTKDSGWYDHQTWSLEGMVVPEKMPEAKHLRCDDRYKAQLIELFKAIIALTRETHVKQLEFPAPGAAAPGERVVVKLYPRLRVEPLATYYQRQASGYRFVHAVLEQTFGAAGLATMHRQTATGPVSASLADELAAMIRLCDGAYLAVCQDIGMTPQVPAGCDADAARRAFAHWALTLEKDPDLGRDVRMMVPIFYDRERKKTKVWAVLGWTDKPFHASFATEPQYTVHDKAGKAVTNVDVEFRGETHRLRYPVSAEVYVSRLLDRDEFRKHCDRYKTRAAILQHLD